MKDFKVLAMGVALILSLDALPSHAQITPSADAYTNTATPTANFGAKPLLDVQSASQNTYIQFDLSSIPSGFTGASVAKATLKLYVNTVPTAGSFNVDFVNGTWDEKSITANLAPALGTTIVPSIPLSGANAKDYLLVDITSAVQAWLNKTQPNDGIALVGNSPLNATFDSKESTSQSHPPELDIVFAGGTGTLTGITTASGSGLIGGGTSGTLNLSLTNTCNTNQVLKWSGSAWACASLSGSGTVTSVGLSAPSSDFTVTGSPITSAGTLGLNWTVAPTSANTANAIVKRDSTGSINANNITTTGTVSSNTANAFAFLASTSSTTGAAIEADEISTTGQNFGVLGTTASGDRNAAGVTGRALNATTHQVTQGVVGTSSSPTGIGVLGFGNGFSQTGNQFFARKAGVWGDNSSGGGAGVFATADDTAALIASNNSTTTTLMIESFATVPAYSFFAFGVNASTDCRIDLLSDLACTGTVTGNAGFARIDHPLDPANKLLVHANVTSPDSKTVYDGVVRLDTNGEAWVKLPEYAQALNGDFRYQLTCIGAFAPVFVADEMANNQFRIAGGKPGMKVSWLVTGIRQDTWTKTHPQAVEPEKSVEERGRYLNPGAFGKAGDVSLSALEAVKQHLLTRAPATGTTKPDTTR